MERENGKRVGSTVYLFHDQRKRFEDGVLVRVLNDLDGDARQSCSDGDHEVKIEFQDPDSGGGREGGREGGSKREEDAG